MTRRALTLTVLAMLAGSLATSSALAASSAADGGGYSWEGGEDGPGHAFEDIAFPENALDLADEGTVPVALEFTFPFYHVHYDALRVDANGLLLFGDTPSPHWNVQEALPASELKGPAIAVYWADLAPGTFASAATSPGQVYAAQFDPAEGPAYLVVQWQEVPHFNFANDPTRGASTFQVKLYEGGRIEIHHKDVRCEKPDASTSSQHVVGTQAGPEGPASNWRADRCQAHGGTFPDALDETAVGFSAESTPQPVPELGSLLLAAVGLAGLGAVTLVRKRG